MPAPPVFASGEAFVDYVLAAYHQDLRTHQGADNYDYERFSYDGVDRSQLPYDQLHSAALKALLRHGDQLHQAYQLMADAASKTLFLELLRYRLSGHTHVRLSTNDATTKQRKAAIAATPYQNVQHNGHGLRRYTLPFAGQSLTFDGFNCDWPFFFPQYFFDRDAVSIKPIAGDHIIDAGACFGETTLAFAAAAGKSGQVHAFEILPQHLAVLRHNINANADAALAPIAIHEQALSDYVTDANTETLPTYLHPGFQITDVADAVAVVTLDAWAETHGITAVDFIKMDIEGSEPAALRGAEHLLKRARPKLAICLYHDSEHFFTIPLWLAGLQCGYKFYLDHYTIHAGETVLYAVAS
jgi:FkbM family methyltransferase